MSEQPMNTRSREHPGHAEPDRYLDDEGRCMFCGRVVALRERDEAQGKLKAVRVLAQEMLKDGDDYVTGYGRTLLRILRGTKEEE